ncbi:MAG: hypothetical protein AAF390_19545, partial [Pseudomonadota bacterium]
MAKPVTQFACSECGAIHKKWTGRCDGCGAWNTIQEEVPLSQGPSKKALGTAKGRKVALTDQVFAQSNDSAIPGGLCKLDCLKLWIKVTTCAAK